MGKGWKQLDMEGEEGILEGSKQACVLNARGKQSRKWRDSLEAELETRMAQ